MSEGSRGRRDEDRVAVLEQAVEARTSDLRAALDERSHLLHELDHRVKNNLQLISSLMLMQSRRAEDPAVREALSAMNGRLTAMGVVHRRLFQTADITRFDLSEFARDLIAELSGPAARKDIAIECDLHPAPVPSAQAAAIALLFNELLSNAFRHAFPPGRAGRLIVRITTSVEFLRIEIEDNGVGQSRAEESGDQGFGLMIVELLARQLQARIDREDADPGVRVTVSLPKRL